MKVEVVVMGEAKLASWFLCTITTTSMSIINN